MATRYVASGRALASAANSNMLSLRSSGTSRCGILELHLFSEAATAFVAPALFLTSVVDTAGTVVAGQKEDNGAAGPVTVVSTGPTGGTLAAVATRRGVLPSVVGSGLMWIWPESAPLMVPPLLSALLRNDGALGPAVTWVVVWQED
ncbi:MAG: hypothetical protein M3Q75_15985 [Gemmatimonadota bacterium]|nr:hypothetical protein [Gemmatimonadota bacterium]